MAVAGQALHVQVVRRQRVLGLRPRGLRVPLRERRLLPERLRQRRVRQRAARVQPLPERVHHADLRHPRAVLLRASVPPRPVTPRRATTRHDMPGTYNRANPTSDSRGPLK